MCNSVRNIFWINLNRIKW